jgi:hypothetical protein
MSSPSLAFSASAWANYVADECRSAQSSAVKSSPQTLGRSS